MKQYIDMSPTVSQILNKASDPGVCQHAETPRAPQSSRVVITTPSLEIETTHDEDEEMHAESAGSLNHVEDTNSQAILPPQAESFAKKISEMVGK